MASAEISDELTSSAQSEARLRAELRYLRAEVRAAHDPATAIGVDTGLARAFESVRHVAPTEAIVLITGEAGTGKELVARAVHAASRRAARPFIKLDCAASPVTSEAALFGGDDGEGRLELAQGGSLFLDEVCALTASAQARLVRVLQEREFETYSGGRVGLDVRIIAATRVDLRRAVQDGAIREDLYYRLNVFPIDVPPLRARAEDIPALVQHFTQRSAARLGRRVEGVDPDTLANLTRYDWPGNVRELANLIERVLLLNAAPMLKIPPEMLAVHGSGEYAEIAAAATGMHRLPEFDSIDLDSASTGLHHVQREHILRVLNATHWVIEGSSGAALKLGMKPATLRHRMKKLGIARAAHQPTP
jgi:formate hydrogenlyase transcriptional activator